MDQKDLIKYGLIAIGAYLIWKYLQENPTLLGGTAAVVPVTPAVGAATTATGAAATTAAGTTAATTPVSSTTPLTCPSGQVVVNGVCAPLAPCSPGLVLNAQGQCMTPVGAVSQQMLQVAGGNSFNMDQWDYFYQVVTGSAFPLDPGSISPGVYAGAGIVDRTTPTDIGTWLAIMQNQVPSLGLSGFFGLGGPRYTPGWLM